MDPTVPSTLYVGTNGGVFKSTNFGSSWAPSGTGMTTSIGPFAIDPAAPATVYCATYAGLFKSVNAGASWALTGLGTEQTISVALAPGTVYVAMVAGGVRKSTDGGASWVPVSLGLPPLQAGPLAVDPSGPTTVYVGGFSVWQASPPVPVELTGFAVQ
jgi:hypothetical protein